MTFAYSRTLQINPLLRMEIQSEQRKTVHYELILMHYLKFKRKYVTDQFTNLCYANFSKFLALATP